MVTIIIFLHNKEKKSFYFTELTNQLNIQKRFSKKVDTHTWDLIHGTKQDNDKCSQSMKHPCRISHSWECKPDTKKGEFHGNEFDPINIYIYMHIYVYRYQYTLIYIYIYVYIYIIHHSVFHCTSTYNYVMKSLPHTYITRPDSRLAPSQWDTSLQVTPSHIGWA